MLRGSGHTAGGPRATLTWASAPSVAETLELSSGSPTWVGSPTITEKEGSLQSRAPGTLLESWDISARSNNERHQRALLSLSPADLKALQTTAHRKARSTLRSLSYPALPPARAAGEQRAAAVLGAEGRLLADRSRRDGARSYAKGPAMTAVMALGRGDAGAAARAAFVESRQPLVEDAVTRLQAVGGASLDWVDVRGLSQELEAQAAARAAQPAPSPPRTALGRPSVRPFSPISPRSDSDSGVVPDELPPLRGTRGSFQATSPMSPQRKRLWPSMDTFERFYHVPPEVVPATPARPPRRELTRLPDGRKTISSLDEAVNFGPDLWLDAPLSFLSREVSDKSRQALRRIAGLAPDGPTGCMPTTPKHLSEPPRTLLTWRSPDGKDWFDMLWEEVNGPRSPDEDSEASFPPTPSVKHHLPASARAPDDDIHRVPAGLEASTRFLRSADRMKPSS